METSRSPWKVLRDVYEFALKTWPNLYSSPWSRDDFTLPQLFACLVVREQLCLSYRKAEMLLRDAPPRSPVDISIAAGIAAIPPVKNAAAAGTATCFSESLANR